MNQKVERGGGEQQTSKQTEHALNDICNKCDKNDHLLTPPSGIVCKKFIFNGDGAMASVKFWKATSMSMPGTGLNWFLR